MPMFLVMKKHKSSGAHRNKVEILYTLDTLEILASKINPLLVLVFLWDVLTNGKITRLIFEIPFASIKLGCRQKYQRQISKTWTNKMKTVCIA